MVLASIWMIIAGVASKPCAESELVPFRGRELLLRQLREPQVPLTLRAQFAEGCGGHQPFAPHGFCRPCSSGLLDVDVGQLIFLPGCRVKVIGYLT